MLDSINTSVCEDVVFPTYELGRLFVAYGSICKHEWIIGSCVTDEFLGMIQHKCFKVVRNSVPNDDTVFHKLKDNILRLLLRIERQLVTSRRDATPSLSKSPG